MEKKESVTPLVTGQKNETQTGKILLDLDFAGLGI